MDVASALRDVEVERIVGPGSEEVVKLGSLWQEQPLVLHFLRRFGCRLCRGGAQQMSKAIPHLMEAGVRVAAVGPEPFGLQEFVDGGFWAGEIYVDDGKKAYKALELRSLSYLQMFGQLFFNPAVKKNLSDTRNVPGNLAGDGMQLGATFVLDKGGAVLLDLRQSTPADHPSPEQLLKLFKIDPQVLGTQTPGKAEKEGCMNEQCHD